LLSGSSTAEIRGGRLDLVPTGLIRAGGLLTALSQEPPPDLESGG